MRKLLLTTAAVAAAIAGAFADEMAFGTFTDTRDGQTYKTVKIGAQTWIARNINYKTESGSWCYNDSTSYCKKYGRLYDWKTAVTVCPKGWKLPSREDWDNLGEAVGSKRQRIYDRSNYWPNAGYNLKSRTGWNTLGGESGNGTDSYGFWALPSGYRSDVGNFDDVGYFGRWWTATVGGSDSAYSRRMDYDVRAMYEISDVRNNAYSVRCVADRP